MTSLSEKVHNYVAYSTISRVLRWHFCLLNEAINATYLVCILCNPNLAMICFVGIIVISGNSTPCHHRFKIDVSEASSEEIGNFALKKRTVSTETMVVGRFIGNTDW